MPVDFVHRSKEDRSFMMRIILLTLSTSRPRLTASKASLLFLPIMTAIAFAADAKPPIHERIMGTWGEDWKGG
jgi:hypothetical protein